MPDVLSEVLNSVRMGGSVFSRAELDAPFAVESGELSFGIFHAVVRGSCWIRPDGMNPTHLERGDIVLLPFGCNHVISDRSDGQAAQIGFEGSVDSTGMGLLTSVGAGPRTTLLCGTVDFDDDSIHPTMSQLPAIIHVRGAAGFVETCIQLMANEVSSGSLGSDTVIACLTDVVVVYTIREYLKESRSGEAGWLSALTDPYVGQALALIHTKPSHPWTVEELARASGMSRSSFFARFRELLHETPRQYLTRWRIHVAARLLRDEGISVAATARSVGYSTEAAFSNAFLRITGLRPGAYRKSPA